MRSKAKLVVAIAILLMAWTFSARADREETIFYNNFDNIAAGTLPAPWLIDYSGAGSSLQGVSTERAFSGSKSLKLVGREGYSAVLERPISTTAPVLVTSYRILIAAYGKPYMESPGLFCLRGESYWGTWYGAVVFDHATRKILDDQDKKPIGDWSPNTWYQVRALVDRVDRRYKIWIDGQLKVDGRLAEPRIHPDWIDSLALTAGHAGVPVYYDNVRVFLPGIQETGRLLLDEIDLLVSRAELDTSRANQLRAHIYNALENEDGGDIAAAITDVANLHATAASWGLHLGAPDRPPILMEKDLVHIAQLAHQMAIQLQKRLR